MKFKPEGNEKFLKIKVRTYVGMRISDGYQEIIYDKKRFAEKYKLDLNKLKYALRIRRRVYFEELPLWIFKKLEDNEKYPKVKIYIGYNSKENKEEKFTVISHFAKKYNLHTSNIRNIIAKKKYYHSTKGWTFKCLEYAENKGIFEERIINNI